MPSCHVYSQLSFDMHIRMNMRVNMIPEASFTLRRPLAMASKESLKLAF